MKVLMVCLGNICRSPLAQGILEHKLKQKEWDWVVDSAGTGGGHSGLGPDNRSQQIAMKHGIDISAQEARRIRYADINEFDIIYCMDSSNLVNVRDLCHTLEEESKVKLIMDESDPGKRMDVPDPYYGGAAGFERSTNCWTAPAMRSLKITETTDDRLETINSANGILYFLTTANGQQTTDNGRDKKNKTIPS